MLAALELDGVGTWLWLGGVIGAFFTGVYSFRLVFVVFFGESHGHDNEREEAGWNMAGPLFVLMVLSLLGGFISIPVDAVFNHGAEHEEHHVSALVHGFMIAVPLLGIAISYLFYGSRTLSIEKLMQSSLAQSLHRFWYSGWGMDRLYNTLFVNPFVWLARLNRKDIAPGAMPCWWSSPGPVIPWWCGHKPAICAGTP